MLRAPHTRSYRWATLLGLVLPGTSFAADPTPEASDATSSRFDLHYLAPSECPARREFVAWTQQFFASTENDAAETGVAEAGAQPSPDWQALPGELAGSIQIKVRKDGTRYTAHLLMVDAHGKCATSRPPHTETECADAARAMAYSLAQVLKAPPCAAGAPAFPEQPPLPSPPKPAPPKSAKQPAQRACPPAQPCPEEAAGISGELGVSGGLIHPLADDTAWGGALLVGFTNAGGAPSARVSAGYWNAGLTPVGHTLRAQLWSVSAAVCPWSIAWGGGFTQPFCATGEVGRVALSGVGSAAADSPDADDAATDEDRANLYLWGSVGVATRLRWETGWLFAEIEPNLLFPLLRHPIYVHQPSSETSERQDAGQVGRWVALKAHLNAGIVFP